MKQLIWLAVTSALLAGGAAQAAEKFDFEVLKSRAQALAANAYEPRVSRVPLALRALTYDERRLIRFRPETTLWKAEKLPFQLQFSHPGFNQLHTVSISVVEGGQATPLPFATDFFDYGNIKNLGPIPGDMGFSGFRVLTPLNSPFPLDELIVFEGASYFRALGRSLFYGLSARGLALNTAEPMPEEFPVFEEFWFEKPKPASASLTLYALLDSPSVSGAYRFTVDPGDDTVVDVTAAVFARAGAKIGVLGIAPLSSMFWYGENSGTTYGDFRPEVHDSDGLMLARGNGEWLWRPLTDSKTVRVVAFSDENPKGFGLVQRDRAFASYQDLEAHYHLRPSVWIEPAGKWGKGEVRLVEIPTPDETSDNIVAFWKPAEELRAGAPMELSYRLHWYREGKGGATPPGGYTVATRIGHSKTDNPDLARFVVDFTAVRVDPTKAPAADKSPVEAVVTVGEGAELVHATAIPNPYDRTWRAAFALRPAASGKKPVELRCYLRAGADVLTETWTYLWQP